jgi:hypothetical protein
VGRVLGIGIAALAVAVALYVLWPRTPASPVPGSGPSSAAVAPLPIASVSPGAPLAPGQGTGGSPTAEAEAPTAQPSQASHLRIEPKLAAEPLSVVPHQLFGAWDDKPDSPTVGAHRVFVAVVDPAISDADLRALVRDIRDRERDAEVLDVRIYDSPDAAGRPSWESQSKLVAEVKRNDRLGYDAVKIRGVLVQP